ncbi:hypothetical protein Ddye_003128 [Dipteronia dyeriana]|uniref:Uncharacterized protein n=1 Tax=Dipteronia dyeriana TaxID=168575 RepID=A0AAE0CV68_9ROSI|nr:hypothetical protein Ddye_003128 [Dipteronia dyeriana]
MNGDLPWRSAADSDVVWDRFLPPDYLSAISDTGSVPGSPSPSPSTWLGLSKKELYLRICRCHNLIHNGKMSFWFDLSSGKKCYMMSARGLNLDDADDGFAWNWYSIPEAKHRFPEVVVRAEENPLEIGGKICTSLLSPMTTYVAYLVLAEFRMFSKYSAAAEAAVGLAGSNNGQNRTISFHWEQQDGEYDGFSPDQLDGEPQDGDYDGFSLDQQDEDYVVLFPEPEDGDYDRFYPKKRADGWLESELGEFFNRGDEDNELLMTINAGMKDGLLIQGIEIRPKKKQ